MNGCSVALRVRATLQHLVFLPSCSDGSAANVNSLRRARVALDDRSAPPGVSAQAETALPRPATQPSMLPTIAAASRGESQGLDPGWQYRAEAYLCNPASF